ncbi:MAG: hypothetical protein KKC03_13260, partial [Bacteroidetes bacterium]|nr:hypothetical protein [Bacteroidota bacterium]
METAPPVAAVLPPWSEEGGLPASGQGDLVTTRYVLRDSTYTKYHFVRIGGLAADILTDVGEVRSFTGETPHPVTAIRSMGLRGEGLDPFTVYGDRDLVYVVCSPDAWMTAQLSTITAWDGKSLSVYSISLDEMGVPVVDRGGLWNWLVFSGTVQEVKSSGGLFEIHVESDNAAEYDEIQWESIIGRPTTIGDMLKYDYDSNGDYIVDAADVAGLAADANKLGGQLPVFYDQGGEAADAVAAHNLAFAHANLPSSGEKAALPGTSGIPGVANKYVTNADARNSDARTPTAHAGTHSTGQPDAIAPANIGAAAAAHTH